jgi:hypothetical protein
LGENGIAGMLWVVAKLFQLVYLMLQPDLMVAVCNISVCCPNKPHNHNSLMTTVSNDDGFTLKYQPAPEEGECTLKSIQPLRKVTWKFVLFIIWSVLFVGFPALIAYWYIEFERWLYYEYCDFETATHFYVLNYDEAYTIVEKHEG